MANSLERFLEQVELKGYDSFVLHDTIKTPEQTCEFFRKLGYSATWGINGPTTRSGYISILVSKPKSGAQLSLIT